MFEERNARSFKVDYNAQLSLAMDGNDQDMHFPRMSRRPEGSVAAPLALEAAIFASISHISNILLCLSCLIFKFFSCIPNSVYTLKYNAQQVNSPLPRDTFQASHRLSEP